MPGRLQLSNGRADVGVFFVGGLYPTAATIMSDGSNKQVWPGEFYWLQILVAMAGAVVGLAAERVVRVVVVVVSSGWRPAVW